ncbi:zinc-ribbon domain-containing protein [Rhizobium leguminosarum]|uniref:zinc-ribbon domain-containing protein n=1 Tax=Rhizobium leguminosarum TaxID=384 RepID=UPI003D156042
MRAPRCEAFGQTCLRRTITSAVSQSEAHWKCYKCDHQWKAEVQSRTRAQTRCPNVSCRHSHWTDKPARAGPNTPNRSKQQ